ncbi:membrane protein BILF1 [Common bottlenose dolphin gammaherpesvirus 1 strain Sarasota]|uniref:Membrane protein BILF1 n=1 Tax=Common bottlenose dolphin gammaherpesvirus 1 strain Sarasota TaxID=2022783 RepID=A0A1Z1NDZ9_9GAMA|nr:membrane protein BILF1 [Common bottlenose dolphin gammaherpesvirus 1 strain Sarasota]ARW78077.1 membrane protein BILF1 [Common bottlenose dolphin gammaherpesvirus 1 strain Sarasota]
MDNSYVSTTSSLTNTTDQGSLEPCLETFHTALFAVNQTVYVILTVFILLFMMVVGNKKKLSSPVNAWLFCSNAVYLVGIVGKAVQDWSTPSYRCLISETLILISITAQSFVQLGMNIDRCMAIHSTRMQGAWRSGTIARFCCCSFLVALVIGGLNLLELFLYAYGPPTASSGFYLCGSRKTLRGLVVKVSIEVGFCTACIIATAAITVLSIKRIMASTIRTKAAAAKGLGIICAIGCCGWLIIESAVLAQFLQERPNCPSVYALYWAPLLLAPVVLLSNLTYIQSSSQLRDCMRTSYRNARVSDDPLDFPATTLERLLLTIGGQ